MSLEVVRSLRPRPAPVPKPPAKPAPPLIGDTGNAKVDAIADVINRAAEPFKNAPDPAKGTLGEVERGIGAVMGVVGAPFELLDTGFAMATSFIASALPGFPAATLLSPHLGLPHAHLHPLSLTPPNPVPVPLPSIGMLTVPGAVNVLIGGMPAARAGDIGLAPTCAGFFPLFDVFTGSSNTWITGSRAARMGDITWHCNPASAMNKIGKVMGAIGLVAGAVGAGAAAAAGQAAAAAAAAAQAAADAVALAAGAMLGKDPGIPPTIGAIVSGYPTVLIGGFPMPDLLAAIGGMVKGVKMVGKSKAVGKALKKVGLCNDPGEPVSPFSGEVYNTFEDYVAADTGLGWERHYRSGWNQVDGPLGYGQRHFFQRTLTLQRRRAVYETHDDERFSLEKLDAGGYLPAGGVSLVSRDGQRYELSTDRDEFLVFQRQPTVPPSARLERYETKQLDVYLYYDGKGRLRALSEFSGSDAIDTHFSYDGEGHIVEVHRGIRHQPALTVARYVYHDGCMVEQYDALGAVKRFRYDAQRRMQQGTDRRGYSFHWEYDPVSGRCVKSYGDDGLWGIELRYEGGHTVVKEADGGEWIFKYFPDGTPSHIIGPDGGITKYEKDASGRVVNQIEPGGKEYTWLYDAKGKHFGRVDPFGNLVPPQDDQPRPAALAHSGPHTPKAYLVGRPLARLEPAVMAPPIAVAFQLNLVEGQVARTGSVPTVDALRRVVEESGPDGSIRRFQRDAEGNVVAEHLTLAGQSAARGARGGWTTRAYTSWNLLAAETTALGNTTRYEYSHRAKWRSVVDPNGNRTDYVRDHRHRISEIHRFGGVHRRYLHDAHDAVIEERDGDGNALVTYETGPNGLHTSAKLASGEHYRYEYDEHGQFTQASSSQHEIAQRRRGQRLELDQRDGAGVQHRYDSALGVTTTTYFDRFTVRYSYPSAHQLRVTTPDGSTHCVWHTGSRTIREYGNGTCEALSFDDEERLTARACWYEDQGRVGPFWVTAYHYDAAGRMLARTDTQTGGDVYEYDEDHRLVAHRDREGQRSYAYDPAGNLIRGARHSFIDYEVGNLVKRADFIHFTHDQRYRRARKDHPGTRAVEYFYDSLDQLIEARFSDSGKVWRAAYDGLGRRLWREVDGKRTDFYWDGDRLAAERAGDGKLRVYVYANEDALVPFMWLDYESDIADPASGKSYYLFSEPSGMPVRVEDSSGTEVWRAVSSDPYGELRSKDDVPCPTRLRFAGHFYDEDLGLFYNRFRDYDPELARYLQPDPLGHGGGTNLFAYSANPLVDVDLRGLTHKAKRQNPPDDAENPNKKPASEKDAPLPAGGIALSQRKNPPKDLTPQENYYFDPASGKYKLRPGLGDKSARETHYPGGFRKSTHEVMAARHTKQGQAQMAAHQKNPAVPAPPPVLKKDANGNHTDEPYDMSTERDKLDWRDKENKPIDYYARNEDGSIKHDHSDPPRPITNVTYDHDPPMAKRYNDSGYRQSKADRYDDFNDPGTSDEPKLTPMSRTDNSTLGSRGETYDKAPEGNYFNEE